MNAVHTSYANGTIRNAAGKLVAFYDADAGTLLINGMQQTLRVVDLSHAMDLVAQHAR